MYVEDSVRSVRDRGCYGSLLRACRDAHLVLRGVAEECQQDWETKSQNNYYMTLDGSIRGSPAVANMMYAARIERLGRPRDGGGTQVADAKRIL